MATSVKWTKDNHLLLNVKKTKEMAIDVNGKGTTCGQGLDEEHKHNCVQKWLETTLRENKCVLQDVGDLQPVCSWHSLLLCSLGRLRLS